MRPHERAFSHARGLRVVPLFPARAVQNHSSIHSHLGSPGRVAGELHFDHGIRLLVRERILFDRLPLVVDWYGYEVLRGNEKLFWYDSQPHPDDAKLRTSHPHHKHVPPDIKHNRIPAPQMSFTRP